MQISRRLLLQSVFPIVTGIPASAQSLVPTNAIAGQAYLKIGENFFNIDKYPSLTIARADQLPISICGVVDDTTLDGGVHGAMILNETRQLTTSSGSFSKKVLISKRDDTWILRETKEVFLSDYLRFHQNIDVGDRAASTIIARLHTEMRVATGTVQSSSIGKEEFFFSETDMPRRAVYVSRLARFETFAGPQSISIASNYRRNVQSVKYRLFFLNANIPQREFELKLEG